MSNHVKYLLVETCGIQNILNTGVSQLAVLMPSSANNIFVCILCSWSVHRESVSIIVQQDATIYGFIIFSADSSIRFGWYPHPSRGARSNCNYNIWHWSNPICYRAMTWRSRNHSSDFSTSADGSKYGSTSARCNYNLSVLLMMDEGNIRNM